MRVGRPHRYPIRGLPELTICEDRWTHRMTTFSVYRKSATPATRRQKDRLLAEMEAWCRDQFGEFEDCWYRNESDRFVFLDESWATAFKLRWC